MKPISQRHFFFGALAVFPLLAFIGPLTRLAGLSLFGADHTHILVIIPLSISLVVLQQKRIFSDVTSSRVGLVPLAAAIAIWIVRMRFASTLSENDSATLLMLGLVMWWVGCFFLIYGTSSARVAAFPLAFLLFAVPVPDLIEHRLVSLLQVGATECSDFLFNATNVPVFRSGFILHLPERSIEIAAECSGIRATMFLLMFSILCANLFLHTFWTRFLLIASVLPISIARNTFRIFALVTLDMDVAPGTLDGKLHQYGGIPLFAATLIVFFVLVKLLAYSERKFWTAGSSTPQQASVEASPVASLRTNDFPLR